MVGPAQVAPGVYALGSDTINWYLVEADGGRLTAVDGGVQGFAKSLESDLAQIGHSLADIEAIVLTHADADHTGVAPRLKEAGARVLVQADEDAALRKPGPKGGDASLRNVLPKLPTKPVRTILLDILRNGGGRPARVEGAETFTGAGTLDVPGRPRVIPTPGHTKGHCALHFEEVGALFVGDALLTHRLFTDAGEPRLMPSYFNVDTAQALRSLDAIEAVEAEVVLCGHGEPWRGGVAAAVASARAHAAREHA